MLREESTRPRDADPRKQEREYKVWVRGSFTGTVPACNEREARAHAARIFLVALDEVSVLPPF